MGIFRTFPMRLFRYSLHKFGEWPQVLKGEENMGIGRRKLVISAAQIAAALVAGRAAFAFAASAVSELDPTAISLGYKADASKVDRTKFPKYAPPAACSNCSLYQGKASDTTGPCTIFQGKLVSASGWCSAYTARA